jgi:endonuclease III
MDEAHPSVWRARPRTSCSHACGIATGIVVDTHVGRSRRLGLTASDDPTAVEQDLRLVPAAVDRHRAATAAWPLRVSRAPRCAGVLAEICPSRSEKPAGTWQSRATAERKQLGALA